MISFCPYITFTIVSLCQWNTIASYGKCLLVIRRCLKLYPVSMPVRCDIDLTVIFKSGRILCCINDGCSSHSIYYSSCTPQLGVQLITSSVGFVAPSSLHSQLYNTLFYLSSIIFIIFLIISTIFY